ncbi:cold-shock protein [Patescibacteria group bacterium]
MEQGIIASLIEDKGFGFISREGEDKDIFFHSNELGNVRFEDLQKGDAVTFEITEGPKGLNAVNVNKVEA